MDAIAVAVWCGSGVGWASGGAEERSLLAPLEKGGTGQGLEVPLVKGDLGGSKPVGKTPLPAASSLGMGGQRGVAQVRDLNRPATTVKEWMAQVEAATVRVMNVKLERTATGLDIVLETAEGKPLQVDATKFRSEDNSLIADIPNAVLALPTGQAFTAENPTADIATVQVTQLDAANLRVSVVGKEALPKTEVTLKTGGLAYSLNPEADEADEEIVVTGEGQRGYFAPNASTATRTDAPILDTPRSIQVIPQQVLQDQQIIRVDDAVRNVSGVVGELSDFGSRQTLTLRGFNTDSFANGPILRDGFRVYNNLSVQETANIERIEVLKGPASILFGQNDPGGIINLVTKQPLSTPLYRVQVQAGSFGLVRPSLDFGGPLNSDGSIFYRLNAAYFWENGFRNFETDNDRYFIAPVVKWKIGDRTDLTFSLEYVRDQNQFDYGLIAFGTSVINAPRDRVFTEPDDYTRSRSLTIGYNLEHRFSDNWTLRNAFRYSNQNFQFQAAFPRSFNERTGILNRVFAAREYQVDDYSLQTNIIGKFSTGSIKHTLLVEVDLNWNIFDDVFSKVDSTLLPLNVFNPVYGRFPRPNFDLRPQVLSEFDTETDRLGAFVQDQMSFGDNLILVLGLRFDSVDFRNTFNGATQYNNAWNPQIGLVYKPIETVSLYANYSRSFVPNSAQDVNGNFLEPQKAQGYEVGVKAELLDRKVFATLAYFDITKQNVATADSVSPFASVATGEQRSRGLELDIAGEILPSWNVIGFYAYTNGEVTRDNRIPVGNRLPSAPQHSFGLWTTYQIQTGNFKGLGFGIGLN